MAFLAVCVAVGILANITKPYPELSLPSSSDEEQGPLSLQQLNHCLEALQRMRDEDLQKTRSSFEGSLARDVFLKQYKTWYRQWRKRFEKLGISCQLTDFHKNQSLTLTNLAEIYRRLDQVHKHHVRLVKKYATENTRVIREIHELFDRAEQRIVLGEHQTH